MLSSMANDVPTILSFRSSTQLPFSGVLCSSSASERSSPVGELQDGELYPLSLSMVGDVGSKLHALAAGETPQDGLLGDLRDSIGINASQGRRDSHRAQRISESSRGISTGSKLSLDVL